jgi:hypothetical protein
MDARCHLTLEALKALESVRKVFYFSEVVGLSSIIDRFRIPAEDLARFAHYGHRRAETYRSIVEHVVGHLEELETVAWVTVGNPYVIDGTTVAFRRAADEFDFDIVVVPAISSIDSLIADLGINITQNGLQVFDANGLFVRPLKVDPRIPCLIMQFARAGTRLQTLGCRPMPRNFDFLVQSLARTHGVNHACTVITAKSGAYDSERFSVRIGSLPSVGPEVSPWATLYVPPAKSIADDKDRDREMEDIEALAARFETPMGRILSRASRHSEKKLGMELGS